MQPVTISENDFHALIAKRAQPLLGLVDYISRCATCDQVLRRPLLGELLSQSIQMEELLDTYDASNNCQWCSFRSLTAILKLFSNVTYVLLHIKHALPAYRLLSIEGDFAKATQETLDFTCHTLITTSKEMLELLAFVGLSVPVNQGSEQSYIEQLPPGRLPRNCRARRTETVAEMVALITTAFLNLAADSKEVRTAGRIKVGDYKTLLVDAVSEDKIRSLELRFHNLQSQYDTYVAGTEAEKGDGDLLVLRGHISVVLHLLETATMFIHYYERHGSKKLCDQAALRKPLVDTDALLYVLMRYSIAYINRYIDCAEQLCREMLHRYAEMGQIELPIPQYRGFHVRPSTLISKLVLHYGSEVKMALEDEVYNASLPLELFRANEKINAQKRRWLANEIIHLNLITEEQKDDHFENVIRGVVLSLAQRGKLIIYEQPLQFPEEPVQKEGTLLERGVAEITRFLALGKIDVDSDIKVTFFGDKRVLEDIKLLAEAGYGEDKFGNNVPLHDKLRYLRC